ncbi:MAG: L-threonylcarbamoyladenylate synthase [Cytophagaceae bacterium]|nr:L-threonylcarbamoyladenylate synthase [Cytophagaceae bacterium]MDW8456152.1 L-threonylcarbamoyladenylate synthase [Cytophagaceae bacterium]
MPENVDIAASYIKQGKVVAFPTETVYGLGANALNPIAVARIFEIKERPYFDPLIVHIAETTQLKDLCSSIDDRVYALAEKFWPGPLTIVLPKSKAVPDIVTAGLPTVAVRMPAHDVALELIRKSECPIAAPSANKFGQLSPTCAHHVRKQLTNVDYIIDGGKTTLGIESTIVQLAPDGFTILRYGIITENELSEILPAGYGSAKDQTFAPGMMKSHYSPRKKLYIAYDVEPHLDISKAGLISYSGKLEKDAYKKIVRVAPNKDLKEYAANLFEALHSLEDDEEVNVIVAEPVDESGIGRAIMDRLKKAAYAWC